MSLENFATCFELSGGMLNCMLGDSVSDSNCTVGTQRGTVLCLIHCLVNAGYQRKEWARNKKEWKAKKMNPVIVGFVYV